MSTRVRASQAPISSMTPIRANQSRVPIDRRSCFRAQQCLYFLPLPQGQGSLRPGWLLTAPPLRYPYSNQGKRVHAGIEETDAPMQVRSRHASRRAGETELLASLDDSADLHVDLRQV